VGRHSPGRRRARGDRKKVCCTEASKRGKIEDSQTSNGQKEIGCGVLLTRQKKNGKYENSKRFEVYEEKSCKKKILPLELEKLSSDKIREKRAD